MYRRLSLLFIGAVLAVLIAPAPGVVADAVSMPALAGPAAPAVLMASPAATLAPAALDTDPALLTIDELARMALLVDAAVARQEVAAGSAERAEDAALINVSSLVRRQGLVERRRADLRQRAADRAIALYVSPGIDSVAAAAAGNPHDAAVKRVLATAVGDDTLGLDEDLRTAEADLAELGAALANASAEAERVVEDRAVIEADLDVLERRRVVLSGVLRGRIEALSEEATGHARGEAIIMRLLPATEPIDAAEAAEPSGPRGHPWLSLPADGPITSEFGRRWGRLHKGVDIEATYGTSVNAAAPGTVLHAGWTSGFGYNVVIDHGGGFSTIYAHLQRITTREKAWVERGARIGEVGSTGNSTGPHLHFETRIDREAENPREWLILNGTEDQVAS